MMFNSLALAIGTISREAVEICDILPSYLVAWVRNKYALNKTRTGNK